MEALSHETEALTRTLRLVERPDEIETGVTSLERRQVVARERLENLLGVDDSVPKGSENRPHQYKPTIDPDQDTVIAAKECSGGGEEPVPEIPAPVQPKRPEKGMVHGIWPDELVQLTPYLRQPNSTWPDIIDAADWLRYDLGISKSLWGDACLTMGRDLAAVALAIVSTKQPDHFRTSPGGYFHGLVDKAMAGELHLDRTVWAPRRASESERGRGRGGASARRNDDREW